MNTIQITNKGIRTRELILETAIRLFVEKGYDRTTIREIAGRANVAVGNAYHYFRSKEDLILVFYQRLNEEQAALAYQAVVGEKSLRNRLAKTIRCKLGALAPHRDLCNSLFSIAVRPDSVLSPFSESTKAVRVSAIEVFKHAIEGSDARIPDDLRNALPKFLWLYYMAILFYWLHDKSPLQYNTNELIDLSVHVISRLISISSLPPITPIRRSLVDIMNKLGSHP